MALEGILGKYILEFFGDTGGLKGDLDKLELQATKSATTAEKSLAAGFNKGVASARESVGSLSEMVGSQIGKVGAFITSPAAAVAGFGVLAGSVMVSAIKDAIEYDNAFGRVRVMLSGTGTDIDALKAKLLDITPSMASSAEEAGSLANALSVGFSPDAALRITDTAAKLSRVAGVDLNTAVELLTTTLNNYNLTADESARISDVFLSIFRTAGGPDAVAELSGALSRVLPVAAELKIPFEQVAAALATMRTQGISAGKGAQAIGQILTKVTSEAQKFRDANIDIYAVAKNEGLPGVLNAIKTVAGGTSEDLKDIGIQARTLNALFALTAEGGANFTEALSKIGGIKLDAMVAQSKSIKSGMIELKDAWDDFKISIGTWAVPLLAKLTWQAADAIKEATGQKRKNAEDAFKDPMQMVQEGLDKVSAENAVALGNAAAEGLVGGVRAGLTGAKVEVAAALPKAGEPKALPTAQRARMREQLTEQAKVQSDYAKMFEETSLKQITLDKQTAEARKATEEELLQYDKKSLATKLEWEERIRAERVKTILALLPLLDTSNAEEKKQYEALMAEKNKMTFQGNQERATAAQEGLLIEQKIAAARLKLDDAVFAARKVKGQVSIQEEIDRQRNIAAGGQGRTAQEMVQADAEATKLAKQYADDLFAHERALGEKSLADEVARLKTKVAQAKAGTQERMKAEEDLFKKEQELRDKRRGGTISVLEQVKTRMEEKGLDTSYVTRDDVQREVGEIEKEQIKKGEVASKFGAGGGGSLEEVIGGYKALGEMETDQNRTKELGDFAAMASGGSAVSKGPISTGYGKMNEEMLTSPGTYWSAPEGPPLATGIDSGYVDAMGTAFTAVDEGLTKIEARVNESSSRMAQVMATNMEEWFVRKVVSQAERE